MMRLSIIISTSLNILKLLLDIVPITELLKQVLHVFQKKWHHILSTYLIKTVKSEKSANTLYYFTLCEKYICYSYVIISPELR